MSITAYTTTSGSTVNIERSQLDAGTLKELDAAKANKTLTDDVLVKIMTGHEGAFRQVDSSRNLPKPSGPYSDIDIMSMMFESQIADMHVSSGQRVTNMKGRQNAAENEQKTADRVETMAISAAKSQFNSSIATASVQLAGAAVTGAGAFKGAKSLKASHDSSMQSTATTKAMSQNENEVDAHSAQRHASRADVETFKSKRDAKVASDTRDVESSNNELNALHARKAELQRDMAVPAARPRGRAAEYGSPKDAGKADAGTKGMKAANEAGAPAVAPDRAAMTPAQKKQEIDALDAQIASKTKSHAELEAGAARNKAEGDKAVGDAEARAEKFGSQSVHRESRPAMEAQIKQHDLQADRMTKQSQVDTQIAGAVSGFLNSGGGVVAAVYAKDAATETAQKEREQTRMALDTNAKDLALSAADNALQNLTATRGNLSSLYQDTGATFKEISRNFG